MKGWVVNFSCFVYLTLRVAVPHPETIYKQTSVPVFYDGLNYIPPPPTPVDPVVTPSVTVRGDRAFKEVIKVT